MKHDRSDSAFPHSSLISHPGMTLRDYFAGQALAGLCGAIDDYSANRLVDCDAFAADAYGFADAMLKARERKIDLG